MADHARVWKTYGMMLAFNQGNKTQETAIAILLVEDDGAASVEWGCKTLDTGSLNGLLDDIVQTSQKGSVNPHGEEEVDRNAGPLVGKTLTTQEVIPEWRS